MPPFLIQFPPNKRGRVPLGNSLYGDIIAFDRRSRQLKLVIFFDFLGNKAVKIGRLIKDSQNIDQRGLFHLGEQLQLGGEIRIGSHVLIQFLQLQILDYLTEGAQDLVGV